MLNKWMRVFLTVALALMITGLPLSAGAQAASEPANQPGAFEVTIRSEGEDIVGGLGSATIDEKRGQMAVCFASIGLENHIRLTEEGDSLTIIVPVMAVVTQNGETLSPVDGTFFKNEAWWYFDTKQLPDTVTFYPHGGQPDGPGAVIVDAGSRRILSVVPGEAPAQDPTEAPTEAPDEATDEATADEPTEEPDAGLPSVGRIDQLLSELADGSDDPWVQAILEAGCELGESPGIALRSFDPRLKELPSYAKDPQAWMEAFQANVQRYDLMVQVEFEGGAFSAASEKSLLATVAKAAKTAKSAFDQKQVRVAVADWLLPLAVDSLKAAEDLMDEGNYLPRFAELADSGLFEADPKWYAPLMYAQSKQSLSVTDGPHALVLTITGADPDELPAAARMAALAALGKLPIEQREADDRVERELLQALIDQATALRKGGGSQRQLRLNIDHLFDGEYGDDYLDYLSTFRPGAMVDMLVSDTYELPEAPALDFPKTGRISGSKSGTQVNIKAPKDGVGRYVQIRDVESKEMLVDMFIRPGQTCTVRVPRGQRYLTIASGASWYGVEALFGAGGKLSKTVDMEVKSSKYYHTITLLVSEEGNMPSYEASASDFAP